MEQGGLRGYTKARLKTFYKEELDGLFNEVPALLLRIDRIVRQPKDHPLLIGGSKAGKTTLVQSSCKNEKICSIVDKSSGMGSGFLDRMNPLRANGEAPGLFERDEPTALMTQYKEGALRQGLLLNTNEELYKGFTQ